MDYSPITKDTPLAKRQGGLELSSIIDHVEDGIPFDKKDRMILCFNHHNQTGYAKLLCMAMRHHDYYVNGASEFIVLDTDTGTLVPMRSGELLDVIQEVTYTYIEDKHGNITEKRWKNSEVSILLETIHRRRIMDPIEIISRTPVVYVDDGKIKTVSSGYCEPLKVYVIGTGKIPRFQDWKSAVEAIQEPFQDYRFKEESDRTRAISAVITPMTKTSGLLAGHAPSVLYEADASQSGKTEMARLTAAIYGSEPAEFTQKGHGGVGSLDERISMAMISGRPFILLDNYRGTLDSQYLEGCLTGRKVPARAVRIQTEVDASKHYFSISSNGMSVTQDLLNRMLLVRIQKQPGKQFPIYAEGELSRHVLANHERYYGAVRRIVKRWHDKGCPRIDTTRHHFAQWAGSLNWIMTELFGWGDLFDGLDEAMMRVREPALTRLRQICLALEKTGRLNRTLSYAKLAEVCEAHAIDTATASHNVSEEQMMRNIGIMMGACFGALEDRVEVCEDRYASTEEFEQFQWEGFWVAKTVVQTIRPGKGYMPKKIYRISKKRVSGFQDREDYKVVE